MKTTFLAIAVLFFAALSGAAQARVTETRMLGGPDGGNWRLSCNEDALVGLKIRQGDAVDRVTLICAQVHKEQYLGDAYVSDQSMGGSGGKSKTLQCPANSWVTGLSVQANRDVNNIALICSDIVSGRKKTVSTDFDPDTGLDSVFSSFQAEPETISCPKGQLAFSVNGRAGSLVHAIGLRCEDDPFQTASTPAPAKKGSWAAFAKGNGNYWGYAHSRPDVSKAAQDAMSGCGGLNNGCNVFWTTQAACVAFAMSGPPYYYAAGGGANKQAAEQNAIKYCQSGNAPAGSCRVLMAQCQSS